MAINIGAVLGPIVCVLLVNSIGWHDGLRAAALFILIGLVTYIILVVPILAFGDDRLSPIWPFLYFAMMGFSFLFYWPVTLALVSRAAPAPVNATMMGMAFLALFVGSNIMGRLGGLYEVLSPAMFWSCMPLSRRRAAWLY